MKTLDKRQDKDLYGDNSLGGWHHNEVISNGATSDPVHIPPTGRGNTNGSVAVVCGAGQARIEFTIDTTEEVSAGTAAWFIWDKGIVTGNILDVFTSAITALRCVSISGPITWKVLI